MAQRGHTEVVDRGHSVADVPEDNEWTSIRVSMPIAPALGTRPPNASTPVPRLTPVGRLSKYPLSNGLDARSHTDFERWPSHAIAVATG
jgi:hypothetical protein